MKTIKLSDASTPKLVELFALICVAQDEALLGNELAKFNRLFHRMQDVSVELKQRDSDQRRALLVLFDYPNIQVQLKAAKHTLAVAPLDARRQIEAIAEAQWFPQSGEAGMCLALIDDGTFKPT